MILSHINVVTSDGQLKSIFATEGINRYRPTEEMLEKARQIVKERYPDYRSAMLVLENYDQYGDNTKSNLVKL